jgi:putative ABC transport system substrate-binding protein
MLSDAYREEVKNRMRQLFLDKCDVFMPIGEFCTLALKEVLDELGGHPTIFIGVFDPIGNRLAQSLGKPEGCMTGVHRELLSATKITKGLSYLYPLINNVLIPYTPTGAAGLLARQVIDLKKELSAVGMQVFTVPIDRSQESLFNGLNKYCGRIDSVLLLEGCVSNKFQTHVAYYCWKNELLLCGSGTYAIDQGAACAFSGEIKECVIAAYQALRSYHEKNTPISTIPINVIKDNQEFCVNIDILRKINFSPQKIEELKNNPHIKVIRKWINSPE